MMTKGKTVEIIYVNFHEIKKECSNPGRVTAGEKLIDSRIDFEAEVLQRLKWIVKQTNKQNP